MKLRNNLPGFLFFTILFFLLGLTDLVAVSSYPSLRWVSKPLIMISLMIYYLYATQGKPFFNILFFIGLAAALLGDIFLLFNGEQYFLLGLSSFLVMQVLYIITFVKGSFHTSRLKIIVALGLLLTLVMYLVLLWPHLQTMAIPVSIYSSIIVIMAICALMRNKEIIGYYPVFIGALFFLISDGLIAWNRFMVPIEFGGLLVMATYIIAQYLILMGMLRGIYKTNSE